MPSHPSLTRREFLRSSSLALAGLALAPLGGSLDSWQAQPAAVLLGRVTRQGVAVHAEPNLESPRLEKLERDALLPLSQEVYSPHGPDHNPRWYHLTDGYLHSAYVQRLEAAHLNPVLSAVPSGGLLGEVTVPFTQTLYQNRQGYWVKLYRLYYGSLHWITAVEAFDSGEWYYRLTDEWLRLHYWAPAADLRPLQPEEFAPLHAFDPPPEKRLVVSLARQSLSAYLGDDLVRQCPVSTGLRYMETPSGDFKVDRKFPSKHMGDGGLTSDIRAYELVGVPWVSFFHAAGIAFHGTFWHDNFGAPMSHGCVNLRNADALWLFRWTQPAYTQSAGDRPTWKATSAEGTQVLVTET